MSSPTILVSVNRNYTDKLAPSSPHWQHHTTSFEREARTPNELADVIKRGFSIAALHHTRRNSDNFISSQLLGLDFDTEDDQSRLETLLRDSFIAEYGALVHTTSSHTPERPRARVLFFLDKPLTDPHQYVRYAKALNWKFGISDAQCTDAARVWFGAIGCNVNVREDRILPTSVLDKLVKEHERHLAAEAPVGDVVLNIDVEAAVETALEVAEAGTRNTTGFALACRMRDAGLSQDEAASQMKVYQSAVEHKGDHPFTWKEAAASLRSAYSHPPRSQSDTTLQAELRLYEWAVWTHSCGLKQGGVHYALKTAMAIADIARKAYRTHNLDMPLRGFINDGIPKATAGNHLKVLCDASILVKMSPSDGRRGARYSINVPFLRQLATSSGGQVVPNLDNQQHTTLSLLDCPIVAPQNEFEVEQSKTFQELQGLALFRHGARIDPRLWKPNSVLPDESFGPAAQRLIATLADCEVESKRQLFAVARVSPRTGKRKARALEELGIITYEVNPDNASAHIPHLVEDWYEQLLEMEPAFTTYGLNVVQAERYEREKIAYHSRQRQYCRTKEEANFHETTEKKAADKLGQYESEKQQLIEKRKAYAAKRSISVVVPIASANVKTTRLQPNSASIKGREIVPNTSRLGRKQDEVHAGETGTPKPQNATIARMPRIPPLTWMQGLTLAGAAAD